MKIAIGSDKSGFLLKESIKSFLKDSGIEVDDMGTQSIEKGIPFYVVANKVAPLVQNGTYKKAILICGTGMGMSIVSNKYKNVYAACVESVYTTKLARAINNANILCLGGWHTAEIKGVEMVKTFLNTEFLQDLEDWRQEFLKNAEMQVKEIENSIYDK